MIRLINKINHHGTRMKKTSLIALLALLSATAQAEESPALLALNTFTAPEITVSGKKGDLLQNVTGKESALLNPSQMSVYKVIGMMPSISQQSVDPYGLADTVNYHEAFRFRGVEATAGGVPGTTVNVEGLPVTGRPGGGATIYDLENFENIAVYSGVMPANIGLGVADVGGKIDMTIKRPGDKFGVTFKQSIGSHDFSRTYLRIDTGNLGSGLKAFASGSTSYAEKWKGYGASNRNNLMFGATEQFSDKVKLEVFATYSKGNIHPYKALGYAEILNLDSAYDNDYGNDPTKYDYYGYNKNEFEDWMVMANLEVKTGENSKLNVKPYSWSDKGYYMETITQNSQNMIRRWDIDHDLKGVLAEYATKLGSVDLDFGYLYHTQERPGPPTSWKNYTITGNTLQFKNWSILSGGSNHVLHEPFFEAKYRAGDWLFEGGVKYVNYTLPSILTYDTTGIGDVSYDDALAANPAIVASKSAESTTTFSRLFPDVRLTRSLGENTSAHLAYGENYVVHVDIYPYFISQYATFSAHGITFDQLWEERKMEISRNFELGLEMNGSDWSIAPTVYYAIHNNKQAIFLDSDLGISYPMNNADATGYGFELEGEYKPSGALKCYGSFSWNRFCFDENIRSESGSLIEVKGKQVPDAPEFMAKGIVSYTVGEFTISPVVRYSSTRYGDVQHQQKIDGATLFDLDLTWSKAIPGLRSVDCSLSFINLFDKKYVSLISTSDYKTLNSSYQPGAPFTVVASVAVHY